MADVSGVLPVKRPPYLFAGHRLVRINLSEQTDMMDLLGADLPIEGGAPGEFAWYASIHAFCAFESC